MSAGRSIVAAGAVGAALLLLKRGLEKQQAQGAVIEPASLKSAVDRSTLGGRVDVGRLIDNLSGVFGGLGGKTPSLPTTGGFKPSAPADLASSNLARPVQVNGGVASLLRLIRSKEAPRGYDDYYRGSRISPPKPLTTMTIAQVLDWQDRSVAAGSKSSAAGGYQFIRKTLRGLVNGGHASMGDKFSPAVQDRLAIVLLNQRGLNSYQAGRMSETSFANNIAKEWASFPVVTGRNKGKSYYAGDGLNAALIGVDDVMQAVRAI